MRSTVAFLLGTLLILAGGYRLIGGSGAGAGMVTLGFVFLLLGVGLRRRGPAEESVPDGSTPVVLSDAELTEVLERLDAGRKIEAVKLVRDLLGVDLRTAKEIVDRLEG